MAFNAFFKKGRLIWDEYYHSTLGNSCVIPQISFDAGRSWMSLSNQATALRNGSTVRGCSIKTLSNGFKQLDLMFGFTPNTIPKIVDYELEEDANGLSSGTYYFAVSCINYDTPGAEVEEVENYYVTGNKEEPFSKLKEIVIDTTSKVKLYINYPPYTRGLAVYYGAGSGETVDLELYHVTNFVQKLGAVIVDSSTDDPIVLLNTFPLSPSGTVKIEDEYIEYDACNYNTDHWELTGIKRGARGSIASSHTFPLGENLLVYDASYRGGLYGEIPARIYSRPTVNENSIQYINFDANSPKDLTNNTDPSVSGEVNYSNSWTVLNKSLRLNSKGYVVSDLDLDTVADEGSLHFYVSFESFNDDNTLDPFIFGTAAGLWMKVNRITLKPYFGCGEVTVIGPEDFRIPSLSKDNFDRIGLTWKANTETGTVVFNISVNGYEFITEDSLIENYDVGNDKSFKPGIPLIGGTSFFAESNTCFNGYIDDWKVYNEELTVSDFEEHHKYLLSRPNVYCGLIEIDANYNNYNTNGDTDMSSYEPLIHTEFTGISTVEDEGGSDFGLEYDDWIVESLLTDGSLPGDPDKKITYPINPDYVQVKFDVTGSESGFRTPIIKNIVLIVSEGALG